MKYVGIYVRNILQVLTLLPSVNSTSVSRRPVQGMGLAQQQQDASVKREPFTRLEVGDGGDVKRMKF